MPANGYDLVNGRLVQYTRKFVMSEIRINRALLILLITAFIAMQWSSMHIHVGAHHDHGGSHHQHSAEFHSHQSSHSVVNHHDDAIDAAGHSDDHQVVEFTVDCVACAQKFEAHADFSVAYVVDVYQLTRFTDVSYSEALDTRPAYLHYSIVRTRAPPPNTYS